MTSDNGTYRQVIDRIEPDLRRIDTEAPAVAGALRTISLAFDDFRREVLTEIHEGREDIRNMKRTINTLLFALLPVIGALIYFGQKASSG